MKISGSIYSNSSKSIEQIVTGLDLCHVDYFHVDCRDEIGVFDDIEIIRSISKTPIDLHIVTSDPTRYFELIRKHRVENVSFQFENLLESIVIPNDLGSRNGLAVMTSTEISSLNEYIEINDFKYILLMTTIPGVSGGTFDSKTYQRIAEYRSRWPDKSLVVDGGVNKEIAQNLRRLGVDCAVSGSYLVGANRISKAMLHLTSDLDRMNLKVKHVMSPLSGLPVLDEKDLNLENIVRSISNGKCGYCIVVDDQGTIVSIVTDGDLRNEILSNLLDLNKLSATKMCNTNPLTICQEEKISSAFEAISNYKHKIMFLPVTGEHGKLTGAIYIGDLIRSAL